MTGTTTHAQTSFPATPRDGASLDPLQRVVALETAMAGSLVSHALPRPLRVAFVGNSLPRRCGIATFTTDLERAVDAQPDVAMSAIIAMNDPGEHYVWPRSVRLTIDEAVLEDYLAAADFINRGGYDVVCLQHEFGIFGGAAGNFVLGLIAALAVPLVTTLHTVLAEPTPTQRVVMAAILARSQRVVVMARMGREILTRVYNADPARIAVIPHGIPDAPFEAPDRAKRHLGHDGHKVILTFGLIGPGKGIETMIEAMPAIVAASPDAVYVVMGATHPHLLRDAGETYRQGLMARVRALGMQAHVVFINRFVDRPELLEHIAMCDVYVTPYLDAAQLTSGTLAYSHGQGRPVVSTPYWHAAELLADGSGVLVPFSDIERLGAAVITLLCNDHARVAMGRRAYAASRASTWERTAARYVECFRSACRKDRLHLVDGPRLDPAAVQDRATVQAFSGA
jgi:glycosyltransferase involved in cell wall biosynthesis